MNGTRDYRSLSGGILAALLFMELLGICVSFVDIRESMVLVQARIAMLTILPVWFAVFRPYKTDIANRTGVTLSALLAVTSALSS